MIKDTNITIMVKDMDRSISFYTSIGFTLKQRWGNNYTQLTAAGIMIGLHPSGGDQSTGSGNVSIGFTAASFEDTKELLKKLLIPTEFRVETGGSFLHFKDPDGTMLYFIEPKW